MEIWNKVSPCCFPNNKTTEGEGTCQKLVGESPIDVSSRNGKVALAAEDADGLGDGSRGQFLTRTDGLALPFKLPNNTTAVGA